MNLHLNKRKNMMKNRSRKIVLVTIGLLIGINIYADKKLDTLELESKDFFKAVTGLEHDYIEEQMKNIKKQVPQSTKTVQQGGNSTVTKELSKDEYSKNTFNYENEMARIKTDFTRTTTLQNVKISSMYSFNGKDYAVLYLDDSKVSDGKKGDEMTFKIDGRYKTGDSLLNHKIIAINTRTKMVELSKIVDENYWYAIYITNTGVFISDLRERVNNIKTEPQTANNIQDHKVEIKPVATSTTN